MFVVNAGRHTTSDRTYIITVGSHNLRHNKPTEYMSRRLYKAIVIVMQDLDRLLLGEDLLSPLQGQGSMPGWARYLQIAPLQ